MLWGKVSWSEIHVLHAVLLVPVAITSAVRGAQRLLLLARAFVVEFAEAHRLPVLIHSSIHRGNIVLKMREEGLEPPKIDYIIYLRQETSVIK